MQKFIPYEKLSKKEQKKYNAQKRSLWSVNPVQRVKQSDKSYNRQKFKHGRNDDSSPAFCFG